MKNAHLETTLKWARPRTPHFNVAFAAVVGVQASALKTPRFASPRPPPFSTLKLGGWGVLNTSVLTFTLGGRFSRQWRYVLQAVKLGRRSMVINLLWTNRPLLSNVWNERRCRWESPSALKIASAPRLTLEPEPKKNKKRGAPISENRPPSYFQKMQHIRFPRGCLFSMKSHAKCRD